ncbi:MAG: hypothetical protein WKF51_11085 [Geodermatophilaceae bacterium]
MIAEISVRPDRPIWMQFQPDLTSRRVEDKLSQDLRTAAVQGRTIAPKEPQTMKLSLRRALPLFPMIAALTIAGGVTAAPAHATYAPGDMLCTAFRNAPVYNVNGYWIYTIPAGRDMRVHEEGWYAGHFFYGHGSGRQDGATNANYFWNCR